MKPKNPAMNFLSTAAEEEPQKDQGENDRPYAGIGNPTRLDDFSPKQSRPDGRHLPVAFSTSSPAHGLSPFSGAESCIGRRTARVAAAIEHSARIRLATTRARSGPMFRVDQAERRGSP
jgi:hypothetical protein